MTSKEAIDKLNRLEFFYWVKPPKTPEVFYQDIERTKKDFALIRKDLEVLEQYKTIEEELGIDLITLFKAYTDGFYVKGEEEKQYIDFENSLNAVAFKNKEMFYGHKWSYQYVKLYDYGKTWALTREELENDK